MADKFRKTHQWRAMLHRDVISSIDLGDSRTEELPQSKGERMNRTKTLMQTWVDAMRAEHGHDVVSDVYRAP